MIKKLGGTRAILAFTLTGAVIVACFVPNMSVEKFSVLGTMAAAAQAYYFSNKATLDKPAE